MSAEETRTAYKLWLVGGIFGWHLLYLRRYHSACLYYMTLGGGILSWLYDYFTIPQLISDHKDNKEAKEPSSLQFYGRHAVMFVIEFCFGYYMAFIASHGLSWLHPFGATASMIVVHVAVPVAAVLGAWLIGNSQDEENDLLTLSGRAIIAHALTERVEVTCLIAAISNRKQLKKRESRDVRSFGVTCYVIFCFTYTIVFLMALTSFVPVYRDADVTNVQHAFDLMTQSREWGEFRTNLTESYDWEEKIDVLREASGILYLGNTRRGHNILDLPCFLTKEGIARECRKKKSVLHPDRKPPADYDYWQAKFRVVQDVCEDLQKVWWPERILRCYTFL